MTGMSTKRMMWLSWAAVRPKTEIYRKRCIICTAGLPGGKTIGYEDGSGSVNLRDRMREAGCTGTEHDYCISHYVISYFYLGAQGKWNYARLEKGEVANVFNDRGVALITGLAEEIKKTSHAPNKPQPVLGDSRHGL